MLTSKSSVLTEITLLFVLNAHAPVILTVPAIERNPGKHRATFRAECSVFLVISFHLNWELHCELQYVVIRSIYRSVNCQRPPTFRASYAATSTATIL